MKKLFTVFILVSVLFVSDFYAQNAPCSDCGNLVISAIINGRTNGRHGVQVCAINDIADMSNYHFKFTDDNLSDSEFIGYDRDGTASFSTGAIFEGSLAAGQCIWIADDVEDFIEFMEGAATIDNTIDGSLGSAVEDDQTLMIICKGNIDDIYGYYVAALDEDGDFMTNATDEFVEGDPYFHDDTWVLSNNDRCPNGGTMDPANWTIGPVDDLDEFPDPDGSAFGEDVDFISQSTFPGANYSHSNPGGCGNVRTCGGLQLCAEVRYECVEDPNGLDDFLMKIDYIGMEPGIELILLELYDCNVVFDVSSDDPATTPDGTIVLLNVGNQSGCGTSSILWGIEFISPGCDGIQFWDRLPEECILECSNGVQDGDEEGVDCGGSCPNNCDDGEPPVEPTCTDGIQNGDEEGIDCGGSCANVCESGGDTCSNGVQDGDEEGVDCGGSCPNACETGGDTCSNGVQDGDEEGVDCGGSCANACTTEPTCTDGVQNGDETGVDCGGVTCPACPVAATCNDGIQNGDETGVDCGGSCPNTCSDVVTVPTMSEWGLIILTLLLLNFVFINVIVGKMAVQGFNNQTINMFNWRNLNSYPFNATLFKRAINYTIAILILIAIFALVVYGFFTVTDVIGLAIASPIFAYLLQLFFIANETTSDNL